MRKTFMFLGVSLGLVISSASADALKNSLTNMLNTKETSGMVDLGNISLDATLEDLGIDDIPPSLT